MGKSPQKMSGDKIVFAARQLYAKIRFRCFVVFGEEKPTRFRKKLNEKKTNKKAHRDQKWVGRDEKAI